MVKYFSVFILVVATLVATAQNRKVNYHPCFLKDSIDKRLVFMQINASRIFIDSFDCKEALLDSIAAGYTRTGSTRYLDALSTIAQNPNAKAQGLYTDVIKKLVENDFTGLVDQLYRAKGKYLPLQNELISTLNIIIDGRPFKRKYMGLLNVEIGKAQDDKDKNKELFLEKLKTKIDEEKYR